MNEQQEPPFSAPLRAALEAARAAARIIRGYYDGAFEVQIKADRSPVTQADVEAEEAIRAHLTAAFPAFGFYGEETGQSDIDADYVWLVDPLDGTKSFVRHYPFVSTQIALWHRNAVVLGVSSAPLFDEIACAERGVGAWMNGSRLGVSTLDRLQECALSSGNLRTLASGPRWPAYGKLVAQVDRTRGFGDFYHYHLLASGKIDLVVESDVNILDIAALSVIVEEAGGTFTGLCGEPVALDTTTVLASNGHLHGPARAVLESDR